MLEFAEQAPRPRDVGARVARMWCAPGEQGELAEGEVPIVGKPGHSGVAPADRLALLPQIQRGVVQPEEQLGALREVGVRVVRPASQEMGLGQLTGGLE